MNKNSILKKGQLRFLALLTAVVFILLSFISCGCQELFEREVPSKEVLYENIEGGDKGYSSVGRYLQEWELPTFNDEKLAAVERCVETYYCDTLPSKHAMAKRTAELFLGNFYDAVDFSDTAAVTDALLTCYMASFGDKYASYRNAAAYDDFENEMSGEGSFVGLGLRMRKSEEGVPYVVSVTNGSPAELAGFLRGDIILAVDGTRVENSGYDEVVAKLNGEANTAVAVEIMRGDAVLTLTPVRAVVEDRTVVYSFNAASGIGLIEIYSFKKSTSEEFKTAVDSLVACGARGLIFDLRNNLGGILSTVVEMVSYLVDDGLPVVSYQYKNQGVTKLDSGADSHSVKLPMVVLTNELTASAAEIFAAALRDYDMMEGVTLDVTLVGQKTYGKGIMQRVFSFTDGSAVTVTVAYYNPPLGVNYHGVGVVPDILAEDSITVSEGDAQLNAAFDAMYALFAPPAAA